MLFTERNISSASDRVYSSLRTKLERTADVSKHFATVQGCPFCFSFD